MKCHQILLFILLCFPILVNSQEIPTAPNQTDAKGQKQGKWVILYDKDWKIIQETEKTEFYRTITYLDDKPIGKVTDWYKNGKPQMIADSLIQEAPAKYEGNLSFFREDGSKEKLQVYKDEKIIEEHFFDKEGNEVEESWKSLNQKGVILYQEGKYKEAMKMFENAKIQAEKEFGKNHPNYLSSCSNLGAMYYKQGMYPQAELLLVETKNIREKILGKNHPDYLNSCNTLGALYHKQGKYSQATSYFTEAKNIHEKISGKDNVVYANYCNNLAEVYRVQGLYSQAEPLYIEAKNISEKVLGKTHPDYLNSCNNLGLLYQDQALYFKSVSLVREAKNISEKVLGKKHPKYATSCNNLGSLYYDQGMYSQAEFFYVEAKNIREEVLGKNHPDYALSCNNLGLLYQDQALYPKAEPLYIEAKNIYEKVFGRKHPQYTTSLNNLANLYHMQGKYSKSELLLKEVQSIREEVFGRKHPYYAKSCSNLGAVYHKQGSYKKAEYFYLKAKNIREEIFGNNHLDYANSCNNLGVLYYEQGLYSKSDYLLNEAKNIIEKILGKKHSIYHNYCNNLIFLYLKQKKYLQTKALYTEIFPNIRNQVKDNFPNLSEINRKQFFQTKIQSSFNIYNSFVLKGIIDKKLKTAVLNQMYQNRLFTKSLLFNSSQKIKERILTSGDSLLVENYQHYLARLRQYNKALEIPITERKKKGISIDTLYLEAQELEKQVSKQSTAFADDLEEYTPHTWQEVQAKLGKNEVAIEIIRSQAYNDKLEYTDTVYYAALIVTPDTKSHPELVVLENGNDLENKYSKNYYQNIDNKKQDGESYLQFWQPIEDKLREIKAFQGKKKRRIYISLDGAYYQINLHTLQNPATGKYLEEDYEIQIVSNTKDLLQPASQFSWKAAEKDAVELFGYPLYDTFPDKQEAIDDQDELDYLLSLKASHRGGIDSTDRGRTWHILFGTKKEIQAIEEILQPKYKVAQHIRTAANETALKNLFSPPILHIATHGYFLADIPQDTTNRPMAGTSTYDLSKNPLLRSGLILAGANHTWQGNPPEVGENGILTAQEAKELNLDHTQLVVLSACETGKGAIQNGEGIFGLQRAFLSAGSDFVLNSLWKVDDEATQILMTYFYKHLLKYSDIRKALKKAKQDLRKYEGGKFDAPKYWGAFVLVGR